MSENCFSFCVLRPQISYRSFAPGVTLLADPHHGLMKIPGIAVHDMRLMTDK